MDTYTSVFQRLYIWFKNIAINALVCKYTLLTCDLLVYTCNVIMGLVLVFANHNVAQCVVISGVSIAQYRTCWNAVGVLE